MSEGFCGECFWFTKGGDFYNLVKALCNLANEDFNYLHFNEP